jgi:hypothetical protein
VQTPKVLAWYALLQPEKQCQFTHPNRVPLTLLEDVRNWEPNKMAQLHWLEGWSLSDRIAVIASIVAFLQFLALVATVFMMVRTARRQLRAYVLVSGSTVTNVAEGDGIPQAQVVIKNFGQTPAYDFVSVPGFALYDYPPPKSITLTVPDEQFSRPLARSVLGPNQEEMAPTDWQGKPGPLTQQEKAALAEGRAIIYV